MKFTETQGLGYRGSDIRSGDLIYDVIKEYNNRNIMADVMNSGNSLDNPNEVSLKSLPKALHPYYSIDCIRSPEVTIEEKTSLVK